MFRAKLWSEIGSCSQFLGVGSSEQERTLDPGPRHTSMDLIWDGHSGWGLPKTPTLCQQTLQVPCQLGLSKAQNNMTSQIAL